MLCKTYRAPKSVYAIQSSESMTAVPAVAMVSDKFNVLDIAVGVNITHPNVGALKISLEAREPCSVHNNMLTHGNAASKVSCVDAETRQTRLLANYGGCVLFFFTSVSVVWWMRVPLATFCQTPRCLCPVCSTGWVCSK